MHIARLWIAYIMKNSEPHEEQWHTRTSDNSLYINREVRIPGKGEMDGLKFSKVYEKTA